MKHEDRDDLLTNEHFRELRQRVNDMAKALSETVAVVERHHSTIFGEPPEHQGMFLDVQRLKIEQDRWSRQLEWMWGVVGTILGGLIVGLAVRFL